MSNEKAKLSILSELLSFPEIRNTDWNRQEKVDIGDLVSLSSAPESKWYLSWVKEIDRKDNYFLDKYLLESIEDGSLCWWSNAGINVYNRERVSCRPEWKWNDNQFDFNNRWRKSCYRHDAYIVMPNQCEFIGDNDVKLSLRVKFDFDNKYVFSKTFKWKKLLMKDMEKFYLECVEKHKNRKSKNATIHQRK